MSVTRAGSPRSASRANPGEGATSETAAEAWFEDHTAEITLKVRASSLAALLAKAGEALATLMLGEDARVGSETAHERVVLRAPDRATLLVLWLEELIYRAEERKVVFTRFDVESATDQELSAEIHGFSPAEFRNPVKAPTYHRLSVDSLEKGGYVATVVLDV